MPKFVVAHKSGAHRTAAIALYRALLSQCNKLEIPAQRRHELSNVIRCRFAGFRHTTSHRQLKLLFEAGYEAVDHLDAAVAGDGGSKQYVLDLLQRAPKNVKNGHFVTRRSISEEYNDPFACNAESMQLDGSAAAKDVARADSRAEVVLVERNIGLGPSPEGSLEVDETKPPISRYIFDSTALGNTESPLSFKYRPGDATISPPTSFSILGRATSRERLGGSGRRHIPKVFSANCIPVLRMKKPQPLALTMYLSSRIKQRQKRHDLRSQLQEQVAVAAQEDEWDNILQTYAGLRRDDSHTRKASQASLQQSRWDLEVKRSLGQVHAYLNKERVKNRHMAEKMYAVVDREESMAEQERQEDERRRTEIAEGLEELDDMAGDIMTPDNTCYQPRS
ncbi:hypothetical protein BST61_g4917 [Cercospora zeina]